MNDIKKIENPIIFIGAGRSGSTIIFEAISRHQDLGWLSNYNYLIKSVPQIGLFHRLFKNQLGEKSQGQKLNYLNYILPRPLEVYPQWGKLCGNQFRYSSLHNITADEWQKKKTRNFFIKALKWQGKKRLAIKITGPPRLTFLQSLFPDAYFIDIIRHPVSVVNSYLNVGFWKKKGTHKPHWDNFFTQKDYTIWDSYNRSPIALAALEWNRIRKLTEAEMNQSNCYYKKIKYEEFLKDPVFIINEIQTFSRLKPDNSVNNHIYSKKYTNKNVKALSNLSLKDISIIQDICGAEIKKLNYEFY